MVGLLFGLAGDKNDINNLLLSYIYEHGTTLDVSLVFHFAKHKYVLFAFKLFNLSCGIALSNSLFSNKI